MSRGNSIFVCQILLALAAAGLAGCAQMTIDVDVYKGDFVLDDRTKIAAALGVARRLHDNALVLASAMGGDGCDASGNTGPNAATHTPAGSPATQPCSDWARRARAVAAVYDAEEIEHWAALYEANPNDDKARARLLDALTTFGKYALDQGSGMLVRGMGEQGLLLPFMAVIPRDKVINRMDGGFSFEQGGNTILQYTDSIRRSGSQAEISQMLRGSMQGPVSEAIVRKSGLGKVVDSENWENINTIHINATGETDYVVIKDAIGNWHIKSVSNDPQQVIDAVFNGATAMVDVVAKVYGLPVNTSGGGQSDPTAFQDSTMAKTELAVARADAARARLRSARSALRAALLDAANGKGAKTAADVSPILDQFLANVDAIAVSDPPTQTKPTNGSATTGDNSGNGGTSSNNDASNGGATSTPATAGS